MRLKKYGRHDGETTKRQVLATSAKTASEEAYYHYCKACKENGGIGDADNLPAAEPCLAVPAHCLDSTPETVCQVEPESTKPDEIENHVDRLRERLANPVY